jgi:predicted nucleic acid-binding protein
MALVLDVSVVAPWVLLDESHPISEMAYDRIAQDGGWVPELWHYELGNLLVSNERRQRLTEERSLRFLGELEAFEIQVDRYSHASEVLALSRRYHLTFYDAAYLELALRLQLPLATLDRELAAVAKKAKVEVLAA